METLKLHWMGHPLVECKGRVVKLETRKAAALLAYLSLNPGECQREVLATMLWPEGNQQKALANLRRTLSSLNSSLPGWIQANRETIALKRNVKLWVDVEAFYQLLSQCKEHNCPESEMCEQWLEVLTRMAGLYRGDFLEGLNLSDSLSFDEWQFFQREDLRTKYAWVLEKLAAHYAARHQWEKAVANARVWLALDRLHEPAQRMLMRLFFLSGQHSAALRQYEECEQILKKELGQSPEPKTSQLLEEIRSRAPAKIHRESSPVLRQAVPIQYTTPMRKTKFFIPKASKPIVARPRLVALLDKGIQLPLTILSAPAGFGKTTLVSEWVSSIDLPITWLSLDPGDDDPGRFFAYLIAALQKMNENIGSEIQSTLQSGQLPPLAVISANLSNDILAADTTFILVLDDFQMIQDQAILEVLGIILTNPPKQLHLVLITREDPLLPLGRLRASNQMTEIRAEDLRFSEREVDLFLNGVMGLCLSEADIAAMENRTEGWVAGLQLVAIAMHNRADLSGFIARLSGSHRFILSYLTEEVLSRQTEDIQIFLSQTSILDKLCGELCDSVTGRLDSQALLERCYHANLFLIPLDDEGRWYRYHHLFRDLLLNQQSRIAKDEVIELHRRASQWYEGAGMNAESIEHALVAGDYRCATRLLEDHALGMIMQGYLKTVEGWMQAIPSEWQSHNPRANLAFALMHLMRGNYERVFPYLERAGEAISEIDRDGGESKALRAEWLALQANLLNVQGKAEQGIELAEQALQFTGVSDYYIRSLAYVAQGGGYGLTGNHAGAVEAYQLAIQNSRASGNLFLEMQSVSGLMIMTIQHGRLHFAYQVGSQTLERLEAKGATNSPIAAIVQTCLGLACYESNQLEEASSCLSQAMQLSNLSGHNAVLVYSKILLALTVRAQGDSQAAATRIQEAVDLLQLGIPAWLKPEVAARLTRFYLDGENPAAAKSVVYQLEIPSTAGYALSSPSDIPDPLTHREGLRILLCLRFLLHQVQEGQREQKLEQGIDLAGCLVERAMSAQLIGIALQALLLRAQMLAVQGNLGAGLDDLLLAVKLAEPEGYIRTFLDEGSTIAKLLKFSLKQPVQPGERQARFVRKLLASSSAPSPVSRPEEKLIDPLTDREREVMRLMAEGLKYQEIAGRLFITLNTVRFYVKEIYSKLSVNNRTQAIEAAHKHNLL